MFWMRCLVAAVTLPRRSRGKVWDFLILFLSTFLLVLASECSSRNLLRQCRVFTCSSYSKGSSVEQAELVCALCMGHFPTWASQPQAQPVLCSSATQGEKRLLPGSSEQSLDHSHACFCSFLHNAFPYSILFFIKLWQRSPRWLSQVHVITYLCNTDFAQSA